MESSRVLYNYLADRYDLRQQNPSTEILRKKEIGLIKKYSNGIALDLGCGTGYHLDFLDRPIGLDVSEKMVKIAEKKNKPLIQAEIENIPFKDSSINTALCFYSTLNMINLSQGIKEIHRILIDNGLVLISVTSINDFNKKDEGKPTRTKKFRLEGKRIQINLFEKNEIIHAFRKNGFRLVFFDSIFRLQKPRWGNFRKFSATEKLKMKIDRIFPKEWGNFYLFVFEKTASKATW